MERKTANSFDFSKHVVTAHRECATKRENKSSYNTDYIVPYLIDFLAIEKKSEHSLKKTNIYIYEKYYTE